MFGLSLATNVAAGRAQLALDQHQQSLSTDVARLSSGLRINSAADDPSGLAISQTLRSHVQAYDASVGNVQTANNALSVADGALATIESLVQRMRTLAVASASDFESSGDRTDLQAEVSQLLLEINRVTQDTTFDGLALFDVPGPTEQSPAKITYYADAAAFGGPASGIALDVPGTNTPGTVLIASLSVDGGDAVSAPVGWNLVASYTRAGAPTLDTYSHVVGLGDPSAYTWTFATPSNVSAELLAFSGVDPAAPIETVRNSGSGPAGPPNFLPQSGAHPILGVTETEEEIGFLTTAAAPITEDVSATATAATLAGSTFGETATNPIAAEVYNNEYTPNPHSIPATVEFFGSPLPGASEATTVLLQAGTVITTNSTIHVHDGVSEGDQIGVNIPNVSTSSLNISDIDLSLGTTATDLAGAQQAEALIDTALQAIAAARAQVGAQIVGLNEDASDDKTAAVNEQAAESTLADADIGRTVTDYTRVQLLVLIGTSVLAQANADPQSILQLFS